MKILHASHQHSYTTQYRRSFSEQNGYIFGDGLREVSAVFQRQSERLLRYILHGFPQQLSKDGTHQWSNTVYQVSDPNSPHHRAEILPSVDTTPHPMDAFKDFFKVIILQKNKEYHNHGTGKKVI